MLQKTCLTPLHSIAGDGRGGTILHGVRGADRLPAGAGHDGLLRRNRRGRRWDGKDGQDLPGSKDAKRILTSCSTFRNWDNTEDEASTIPADLPNTLRYPYLNSFSTSPPEMHNTQTCTLELQNTALFIHSVARFWRWGFGEFPRPAWAVSSYSSGPPAGGTPIMLCSASRKRAFLGRFNLPKLIG